MVITNTIRRMALGAAAVLISIGLGAGAYAATQQNTAPDGATFSAGRRMGRPFMMLRRMADRLGLTDAQKAQMKTIAQSHKDEWKALAERARTARQSLRAAETADTIDDAAIRQRTADLSAVQADMAVARAHARAEFMQVLTPDQKTQLESWKKK
jgi:Spy/CpxP family protein refolding chaperone